MYILLLPLLCVVVDAATAVVEFVVEIGRGLIYGRHQRLAAPLCCAPSSLFISLFIIKPVLYHIACAMHTSANVAYGIFVVFYCVVGATAAARA